jgi:hypothetical protein
MVITIQVDDGVRVQQSLLHMFLPLDDNTLARIVAATNDAKPRRAFQGDFEVPFVRLENSSAKKINRVRQ